MSFEEIRNRNVADSSRSLSIIKSFICKAINILSSSTYNHYSMKLNNLPSLGKTQKRLAVCLSDSSDYKSFFTLVKIHLGGQWWGVRYFLMQSFPYHMTSVKLRGWALFGDYPLYLEDSSTATQCHTPCGLQTLMLKRSLPSACPRLLICCKQLQPLRLMQSRIEFWWFPALILVVLKRGHPPLKWEMD